MPIPLDERAVDVITDNGPDITRQIEQLLQRYIGTDESIAITLIATMRVQTGEGRHMACLSNVEGAVVRHMMSEAMSKVDFAAHTPPAPSQH